MRILSLSVFLLLCVACIVHGLYYYPLLPEQVASHYDLQGQPNGWSSKYSYIATYFAVVGGLAVLFLAINFGLPKLPTSLVNLPNKDYWLAEERKQQTFNFLFHYLMGFASATVVLIFVVFHQSFTANLSKDAAIPETMLTLGVYLGFTVAWTIGVFVRFGTEGKYKLASTADEEQG